ELGRESCHGRQVGLLLEQDALDNGLGSLGDVLSVDERDHLRGRRRAALALRRSGVTRPGIGRTVARQHDEPAVPGVEKCQSAYWPGRRLVSFLPPTAPGRPACLS